MRRDVDEGQGRGRYFIRRERDTGQLPTEPLAMQHLGP